MHCHAGAYEKAGQKKSLYVAGKRFWLRCFCLLLLVALPKFGVATAFPARLCADTVQLAVDTADATPLLEAELAEATRLEGEPVEITYSAKGRWRTFCDSLHQGWMALAAVALPGSGQVINRDYWKLPVFYGAIAGFSVGAYYLDKNYRSISQRPLATNALERMRQEEKAFNARLSRDLLIAGAGLSYALSVADALVSHSPNHHSPTAAMVCSAILPGLGQIYNRSFWKVPIVYGGLGFIANRLIWNHRLYTRLDNAIVAQIDNKIPYPEHISATVSREELDFYANYHRRNRDLAIIGLVAVYLLNIIDAYVDAHLFYWNVDEGLSIQAGPNLGYSPAIPAGYAPGMYLAIAF